VSTCRSGAGNPNPDDRRATAGRTSRNANIDKLVAWAQGQEEVVKNAQANAREAALRQIREAAASIR
jgi:hypothetical protein